MRKRLFAGFGFLAIGLVCILLILPEIVVAQDYPQNGDNGNNGNNQEYKYQYAAKFICFNESHFGGGGYYQTANPGLIPGAYLTDVNIHNPYGYQVKLRKKLALAYPPGRQQPGPVTNFIEESLESDQALEVNCWDVPGFTYSDAYSDQSYYYPDYGIKGYLVIESPYSLDVTAVYSAGTYDNNAQVQSIAVEQVPQRDISQQTTSSP